MPEHQHGGFNINAGRDVRIDAGGDVVSGDKIVEMIREPGDRDALIAALEELRSTLEAAPRVDGIHEVATDHAARLELLLQQVRTREEPESVGQALSRQITEVGQVVDAATGVANTVSEAASALPAWITGARAALGAVMALVGILPP